MLTVPEAARRVRRNPETIRRWIRQGRLTASRIGTQHVIDERDLQSALGLEETEPLPEGWGRTRTGEPMPDVVAMVRAARERH